MSEIPGDLKFQKSHEWARVEDGGLVRVGISDHAQGLLGDLVYVELPKVGDHPLAVAQHALVIHHHADQLARHAGGLLLFQRGAADEIAPVIQRHGPRKAGFPRRDVLVHVLAVQVHAGFQAQRVTRAKPGRMHARGHQRIPQGLGVLFWQDDFETILAGVTRARHEQRHAARTVRLGRGGKPRQLFHPLAVGGVQQREHLAARFGALHRNHRKLRALADLDLEPGRLLDQPRQILVVGRGVHHHPEIVFGQEVGDQIVNHAAARVQHARIDRLARLLQLVDVVGQQVAQEFAAARAVQVHHGHVRHVEHAGGTAHGVVLLDLRTVVERHVPTAEIHHLRARGAMGGIEDGLFGFIRAIVPDRCVVGGFSQRISPLVVDITAAIHGLTFHHSRSG